MPNLVRVIGVHPVETQPRQSSGETEPVYLIEIEVQDPKGFNFGDVTQEMADQPQSNWQVAYDERIIKSTETHRYCFFFHFLNLDTPLLTSYGPAPLPKQTPIPPHLIHVEYLEP